MEIGIERSGGRIRHEASLGAREVGAWGKGEKHRVATRHRPLYHHLRCSQGADGDSARARKLAGSHTNMSATADAAYAALNDSIVTRISRYDARHPGSWTLPRFDALNVYVLLSGL